MNTHWMEYYAITNEELIILLNQVVENPSAANTFWDRFGYKTDLFSSNYSQAKKRLMSLLHQSQLIEPETYARCHKGTPFYWLGTAAFLHNDYQTATFFFDAAVNEDIRIGAHPITNPTPATKFLTLEGEQPLQAAQDLVQDSQAKVQRMLNFYNLLAGKPADVTNLTMENVREKFLRPALTPENHDLRTLATTFISFFLEWDYYNEFYDIRPGNGTAEPFFLHLFKGCVLFESLLKANEENPTHVETLSQALSHLHDNLGIVQRLPIGGATLPNITANLPTFDNRIESAICFTGKVRNTVGHNLGWGVDLVKLDYQRLFEMIAASCFHAINCLY